MENCNLEILLAETRNAVKASGQTLDQIADGAGLTYAWVAKFSQGKIQNPGIHNLVRLRNYLNHAA
jgi:transcriptional regulator with XRE-family HTH domain